MIHGNEDVHGPFIENDLMGIVYAKLLETYQEFYTNQVSIFYLELTRK